jgi:hypothetical protein
MNIIAENAAGFAEEIDIERVIRAQVGRQALAHLIDRVRTTMYAEALRVSNGNKSVAAKLLGVDRRCVQRMAAQLQNGRPQAADSAAPTNS